MARTGSVAGGGLRERVMVPELMDDPTLAAAPHQRALEGLRRINRLSTAGRTLWRAIRAELEPRERPWRILDLASGGGDVAIDLWRRATRGGQAVEIDGWDVSPTAVDHARRCGRRANAGVRFHCRDVLGDELPDDYDVVMNSLFLHHLDATRARDLLQRMVRSAPRLLLVDDLARSRLGLGLAWLGTRLLSGSPVVRTDGPRSVRAAYTPPEVERLARAAGLEHTRIVRHWPQRYLLIAKPTA